MLFDVIGTYKDLIRMSELTNLILSLIIAFIIWCSVVYYIRYRTLNPLLDRLGEKTVKIIWLESLIILFPFKIITKSEFKSEGGGGGFFPLPFEYFGFAVAFLLNYSLTVFVVYIILQWLFRI